MGVEDEGKLPSAEQPGTGLKGLDEAAGKALSPAAEAFGKEVVPLGQRTGQLTNRVGTLLIRALEPLVYGLEKSADWIEKAVTERLKAVPQDKIVPPNPRIAVPALQALTYSLEDKLIREMFANLLAADMNSDTKKDAHPAFVELIKDLTPADARVLKILQEGQQCSFTMRVGTSHKWLSLETQYSFSIEGLSIDDVRLSVNNLERLGLLVERWDQHPLGETVDERERKLKDEYEPTRQRYDTPGFRKELDIPEGGPVEMMVNRGGIYLTPLGIRFARICLS